MKRKIENFIFDTIIVLGVAVVMVALATLPQLIDNFFNTI